VQGHRNFLYLIVGALIIAVGLLGYNLFLDKKQPDGMDLGAGQRGVPVKEK
jgi:hypothetical protein